MKAERERSEKTWDNAIGQIMTINWKNMKAKTQDRTGMDRKTL